MFESITALRVEYLRSLPPRHRKTCGLILNTLDQQEDFITVRELSKLTKRSSKECEEFLSRLQDAGLVSVYRTKGSATVEGWYSR